MKKIVIIVLAAMLASNYACAQNNEETVSEAVTGLWKKAKQGVKKSSRRVKEEWNGDGLVEVDGHKYMRVFTKDLFKDKEAAAFKEACKELFKEKYPSTNIISVAIPQEEWTESTSRSLGKVSKYLKTVYCYVLAKDGEDGYINARFSFQRVRKVGKTWYDDPDNWPLWERTDVLVPSVYRQLKDME